MMPSLPERRDARRPRAVASPKGLGRGKGAIEMGEERAAARWLPAQVAQPLGREGGEEKAGLTVEVAAGGFLGLGCGGEMDVAISEVDRSAAKTPSASAVRQRSSGTIL